VSNLFVALREAKRHHIGGKCIVKKFTVYAFPFVLLIWCNRREWRALRCTD